MLNLLENELCGKLFKNKYMIVELTYKEAMEIVVAEHYLHRKSPYKYAFGLLDINENKIKGVIVYGTPPSRTLQESVCGKEEANCVIELSRLWVNDDMPKNSESFLIGNTIPLVKEDIIVSFADPNVEHLGIVYQATNWVYTGRGKDTQGLVNEYGEEFHFRKLGHLRNGLDTSLIDKKFLVKARTNLEEINVIEVCTYLKDWKNKKGFTVHQIDSLMGYKHAAGHWFRTDAGKSLPGVDDWWRLKEILEFDDAFDNLLTQYEEVYDRKEHLKELGLVKKKLKGKHRYIYFSCDKKRKRELMKKFKLEIKPYPKGEI